jgi:hypothetical protein
LLQFNDGFVTVSVPSPPSMVGRIASFHLRSLRFRRDAADGGVSEGAVSRKGTLMKATLLALICLFMFAGPAAAYAQAAVMTGASQPAITIKASQSTEADGSTRYEYSVVNRGHHRITAVRIGYDYSRGAFELQVTPRGWSLYTGLAQGTFTSPANWHVSVVTEEESPSVEIEWESGGDGTADILPGQTLKGFSIITPGPDDTYLHGHWTAYLADGNPESAALDAEKTVNTFEGE